LVAGKDLIQALALSRAEQGQGGKEGGGPERRGRRQESGDRPCEGEGQQRRERQTNGPPSLPSPTSRPPSPRTGLPLRKKEKTFLSAVLASPKKKAGMRPSSSKMLSVLPMMAMASSYGLGCPLLTVWSDRPPKLFSPDHVLLWSGGEGHMFRLARVARPLHLGA